MAAHLKQTLGVETDIVRGNSGEFTVWVDGVKVVEKIGQIFPTAEEIEQEVSRAGTS